MKHEQQTSRLEKMSIFFWASNFLRLNNYKKILYGIHTMKLLLLAVLSIPVLLQAGSEMKINLNATAGLVNRNILGVNQLGYMNKSDHNTSGKMHSYDRGYGIWNPDENCPTKELVELILKAGIRVSRYPGGCETHYFNWKKVIGDPKTRQRFGFPEFMRLCEETKTIPIITLADYYGTAKEAAELVEYLNAPNDGKSEWAAQRAADGHPAPYNVVYFECGNETYHGNHRSGDQRRVMSSKEYTQRYLEFSKAMKAVDPNIKLGAVFHHGLWNKVLLEGAGKEIDFFSPHIYMGVSDPNISREKFWEIMLGGINQVPFLLKKYNDEIIENNEKREIPLAITEFNCGLNPIERFSLGGALIVAEMLRYFLYDQSVFMANFWQFTNEGWGMVRGLDQNVVCRPVYNVYYMFNKYVNHELLNPDIKCPVFDSPGGYGMPCASGTLDMEQASKSANLLPPGKWTFLTDDEFKKHVSQKNLINGVLEVDFKGNMQLDYFHAERKMKADLRNAYKVTAEIRTEGMEDSSGAYVQIGDARGWNATKSAVSTERVISSEWKTVEATYSPLEDTTSMIILARRQAGGKGKMFIRNVQVTRATPYNIGSSKLLGVTASKSKDGKTVSLLILNKAITASETLSITIPGKIKSATAETMSASSIDATNESDPNLVSVKPLKTKIEDRVLEVTLPKHSLSGIKIKLQD